MEVTLYYKSNEIPLGAQLLSQDFLTISHESTHFTTGCFDTDIDEVDKLVVVLFNYTFRPE